MSDLLRTAFAHHQAGRWTEAEAAYLELLQRTPQHADALHLLGVLHHQLGKHESAVGLIGRALSVNANVASFHNNFAEALRALGQLDESLPHYAQAIALKPDYADAYSNLGLTLADLGKPAEAIALYQKAIELQPNHPHALWNLSLARLLLGDYARGWSEYESRWNCPDFPSPRRGFTQPLWDGSEDVRGKTILLHCEQGAGDAIQFSRYVPLVAARGARVLLECPGELLELMRGLQGAGETFEVLRRDVPLPPFDLHAPLLSLPRAFNTLRSTIPSATGYFGADDARTARSRRRFDAFNGRMKIGLVWAGNPAHRNDRNRSIRLEQFAPLSQAHPDAVFVSLQTGAAASQAANPPKGMHLLDLSNDLRDFADTAAVMSQLDLIISVDTSTAHLAGALGRPAWTLLPFAPDWRWMLNRSDTPWYASMRLFRQPSRGHWAPVLRQAAGDLAKIASKCANERRLAS